MFKKIKEYIENYALKNSSILGRIIKYNFPTHIPIELLGPNASQIICFVIFIKTIINGFNQTKISKNLNKTQFENVNKLMSNGMTCNGHKVNIIKHYVENYMYLKL